MKTVISFCLLILLSHFIAGAQPSVSSKNQELLHHYEDTLRAFTDSVLDAEDDNMRQSSCYRFIKQLVKSLKVEGSFNYQFDSLDRVSILTPDDHSFRIFNWMLRFDDSTYRYYATIQMNDPKELKMFPLFDYSSFIKHPADTVTGIEHWYGALYYKLLEVKNKAGKPYYILLGWDGNDSHSNKKIIEVLSFNSKKQPVFGSSLFDFGIYDERNKIKRFILEYKEMAQVSIHYDDDLQMIIYDHLQPESPATKDDFTTYIPDGTYEGFRWANGKWHYTENVFTTIQKEPPFPNPINFDKERKLYGPK